MTPLEQVKTWYEEDISSRAPWNKSTMVEERSIDEGEEARWVLRLFTDNNQYNIYFGQSYIGCSSCSRKTRAGEDWHRGNDLHDGPLIKETWSNILLNILSYELVNVNRQEAIAIPDGCESVL